MNIVNERFRHRHSAHCESGVAASLLTYHGVEISEAMAFGLAAGIAFAYLPFLKLAGFPLIGYRMPPKSILKGVVKVFASRFRFETFRDPLAGMRRLDELLLAGHVVGLQTSAFWLPYFPEDMRFHFNMHNLLVYGKEGEEYLISDPVGEDPVRCSAADLQRARFAKGLMAPKGLLYYPESIGQGAVTAHAIRKAIRKTVRSMLNPVPIIGVRGIRTLAGKVANLSKTDKLSLNYVGHIVRMQEEIGTGGAGFRFLYAAFLQEAAEIAALPALRVLAERMTEIGDGWREFALRTVRMIREREAFDPQLLAEMLRKQADQEEEFFRALKRAVD